MLSSRAWGFCAVLSGKPPLWATRWKAEGVQGQAERRQPSYRSEKRREQEGSPEPVGVLWLYCFLSGPQLPTQNPHWGGKDSSEHRVNLPGPPRCPDHGPRVQPVPLQRPPSPSTPCEVPSPHALTGES